MRLEAAATRLMSDLKYRRLRAPADDGAALVDPPLESAARLIEQNRALSADWRYDCQGRRLESMVFGARAELHAEARAFTGAYRNTQFAPPLTPVTPFILAGHQPELFHAGVWFKNFLLSKLGRPTESVAINLLVDTDLVRKVAISVPAKTRGATAIESVAYDTGSEAVPYEERPILDDWLFESFGERAADANETARVDGHEAYQPVLGELWGEAAKAVERQGESRRLGLVLAEARHALEERFGLTTLEIPLSLVAQTTEFRWFAVHLLCQLPRLWRVYNTALAEYRQANRIRSNTHPVPGLQEHDDWLEAPFFVWTKDDPRRRHLFVRQTRTALILSDRQGWQLEIDNPAEGKPDRAIERLAAAEERGIKIRPRALITTMYARLLLSDLFIHGIGGAKYDELTDLIIRRFFEIEPPAYMTATATFRLPIERPEVTLADVERCRLRIRETRYRPESFLREPLVMQDAGMQQRLEALAAEKRDYLARHDLRRAPRAVFQKLDRMNRAMNALLRPVEEALHAELTRLGELARQARVLAQREFSFVLFPSEILPARLLDLCKVSS